MVCRTEELLEEKRKIRKASIKFAVQNVKQVLRELQARIDIYAERSNDKEREIKDRIYHQGLAHGLHEAMFILKDQFASELQEKKEE